MTFEVLGIIVTDDTVNDNKVFAQLIEQVLSRGIIIERVLADGGYDPTYNFDLLRGRDIEAGIKMAYDARTRSRGGTSARRMAVIERDELGQEGWEERYAYSLRWMIE